MEESPGVEERLVKSLPIPRNDRIRLKEDGFNGKEERLVVFRAGEPMATGAPRVKVSQGDNLDALLTLPFPPKTKHMPEVSIQVRRFDVVDQGSRKPLPLGLSITK